MIDKKCIYCHSIHDLLPLDDHADPVLWACDDWEECADRIEQERARHEWRDISTAPRDGTWVLLTGGSIEYGWDGGDSPRVVCGQWTTYLNGRTVDGHWQFAWYDGGYYGYYDSPTAWMPLPPPPAQGEAHG